MTKATLTKKKKDELVKMAKDLGVKNASKMKKSELIEAILKAQEGEGEKKAKETKTEEIVSKTKEQAVPASVVSSAPTPPPPPEEGVMRLAKESVEIPEEYGDTKIVLLIQDPYWLHAYWEIGDDTRGKLGLMPRGGHGKKMVMRVYDITGVDNFDGTNYVSFRDIEVNDFTRNWYFEGAPDRAFVVDLGVVEPPDRFILIARSNIVRTPRDTVSDRTDEEWMIVGEDFERIFKASGGEILKQVMGSGMLVRMVGAPSEISSGGVASSFAVIPVPPKEKEFWLEVHTELIVYGATEPDAKVTIMGEEVKLDEEGKFATRFYLPEGKYVIPVVATSADGEDRITIIPVVVRSTDKQEHEKIK